MTGKAINTPRPKNVCIEGLDKYRDHPAHIWRVLRRHDLALPQPDPPEEITADTWQEIARANGFDGCQLDELDGTLSVKFYHRASLDLLDAFRNSES